MRAAVKKEGSVSCEKKKTLKLCRGNNDYCSHKVSELLARDQVNCRNVNGYDGSWVGDPISTLIENRLLSFFFSLENDAQTCSRT